MKRSILPAVLFITAALFLQSCKKDITDIDPVDPYTGTGNQVKTSISGVVVDESNTGISGATIDLNGMKATTNNKGVFIFENVEVSEDRFYLTAEKTGFMDGSRAAIPSKDGVSNLRIMMIDNSPTGTISASSGGTVQLSDGSSVIFPSDAFVDENGNAYSAMVNVSMNHLDPSMDNFSDKMPGDLRAVREDGSNSDLESYGMLAVELTGTDGKKLNLAPGKEATLNMTVPSGMLSSAQSTIPLWYFDETEGVWREDGDATLQGNLYVGTVSHFTFWNCDQPYPRACVKGRVIDCNGDPVAGVKVRMESNSWRSATTDEDGWYHSDASATITFELKVFGDDLFGLESNTITVGPLSPDECGIADDIIVPCPARVKGTVTDCDGNPTSGVVYVSFNNSWNVVQTSDGSFNIPVPEGTDVEVFVYTVDGETNGGQSHTVGAVGSTTDIGNVAACIELVDENSFVINGGQFNNELILIAPNPQREHSAMYYTQADATSLSASSAIKDDGFYGYLPGNSAGTFNTTDPETYFDVYVDGVWSDSASANMIVVIDEYGPVGGKITGTFSGTFEDWQGTTTYTITNGKFSVIRRPDQ